MARSAALSLMITGATSPGVGMSPSPGISLSDRINSVQYALVGRANPLKLYKGDHWQGGAGWIGPRPPLDDAKYHEVMLEVFKNFISANAVKDIVDRHRDAVVGDEPSWSIVPDRPMRKKGDVIGKKGEQKPGGTGVWDKDQVLEEDEKPSDKERELIAELNGHLVRWWDDKEVLLIFQEAVVRLLTERRGYVRVYIPSGLGKKQEDGSYEFDVAQGDVDAAIDLIHVCTPEPDQAVVYVDQETMQPLGLYKYSVRDVIANTTAHYIEATYLDDDGDTVVRRLGQNEPAQKTGTAEGSGTDGERPDGPEPLKLGRRLTLLEMRGESLISEQVCRNQLLLNMDLTMLGRNVVQGGFLERIILNAQMPGKWVDDDRPGREGKKRFVPDPVTWGAGTTNVLKGETWTEIQGEQKKVHMATPSVVYRDPVDVKTFIDTARQAYVNMLRETKQLHSIISGDAQTSGESRKQAEREFARSVRPTKNSTNAMGRKLLEVVARTAAQLAGDPERYKSLRIIFECQIDLGPMSAEDRSQTVAEMKEGYRSRESGISMLPGIEDVDAEITKIDADAVKRAALLPTAPQSPPGNNQPPGSQGNQGAGAGAGG
jgi:hypothetical protein